MIKLLRYLVTGEGFDYFTDDLADARRRQREDRDSVVYERMQESKAPTLLKELETAIAWIEQLQSYDNPDPSAPSKDELLEQLRAALS